MKYQLRNTNGHQLRSWPVQGHRKHVSRQHLGSHHGPRSQLRPCRSDWPLQQHCPQTLTWSQMSDQTPDIHMATVIRGARDINSGPRCSRMTYQTWSLAAALARTASLPSVIVLVTQIVMALMVAQPSAMRMIIGRGLDPWHLCGFSWPPRIVDDQDLVSHLRPYCRPALYCHCYKGHTNLGGPWCHWSLVTFRLELLLKTVFGSVVLLQQVSVLMLMTRVTTGFYRSCSCWNLWTVLSQLDLLASGIADPAPHLTWHCSRIIDLRLQKKTGSRLNLQLIWHLQSKL